MLDYLGIFSELNKRGRRGQVLTFDLYGGMRGSQGAVRGLYGAGKIQRAGRAIMRREGVERIFTGKRNFHKALANLPIEEKIKAVAALQRIDYSIKPAAWKKRMMWPSAAE